MFLRCLGESILSLVCARRSTSVERIEGIVWVILFVEVLVLYSCLV